MNSLKLLETYSSSEESSQEPEKSTVVLDHSKEIGSDKEASPTTEVFKQKDEYSASESIQDKWAPLPLPAEVQLMFNNSQSSDYTDSSGQHGGKIRSFPHERGVWPTFVYIEYVPDPEFYNLLESFIRVSKLHNINLTKVDHFHISLSRTLKLRYHWIPAFVEALKVQLIRFYRFKVMLQSPEVYINDEKTRTFLGLKVHFGLDNLERILKKIDKCLEEFKLPFFHEDPSFHLSCCSCLGDKVDEIDLVMADLNDAFLSFVDEHPQCKSVWVSNVQIKTGNKLFSIPLKS